MCADYVLGVPHWVWKLVVSKKALVATFFVLVEDTDHYISSSEKFSRSQLWEHLFRGLKVSIRGFPGGAVVESLPADAGDTGSSPGLGRSHMLRSNWAREPQLLSLRVWSLCPAAREATTVRGPCTAMKSGPRSPQLEKALTRKRRPNTAKINK